MTGRGEAKAVKVDGELGELAIEVRGEGVEAEENVFTHIEASFLGQSRSLSVDDSGVYVKRRHNVPLTTRFVSAVHFYHRTAYLFVERAFMKNCSFRAPQ
jgi:hypothetical protein